MLFYRRLIAVFAACFCQTSIADVSQHTDPSTGLINWTLSQGALELQFIQRLPDQTRGFFSARGFSREVSNNIATSCVLQMIMRNTHSGDQAKSVSIRLKDWLLKSNGISRQVKLKEQWDVEWQAEQVSQASRVAFRWATFPSEQIFEPIGDNNWGMASFDLPPKTKFDLQVVWIEGNKTQQHWIKNMICPEDR